jgi:hypothetical protein
MQCLRIVCGAEPTEARNTFTISIFSEKEKSRVNYFVPAPAIPLNTNAKAPRALANALPPPAHASVLPPPAQTAFTVIVAVGTITIIALMTIIAPTTRRFVFIDLP